MNNPGFRKGDAVLIESEWWDKGVVESLEARGCYVRLPDDDLAYCLYFQLEKSNE